MAWLLLVVASVFEACWALGLPHTAGFSKALPSVLVGIAMVLSFVLLAQAAKTIPVGTAYAVWVGLGLVLTVAVEALLQSGEQARGSALRWVFVAMIVVAVVGLKLTAPAPKEM